MLIKTALSLEVGMTDDTGAIQKLQLRENYDVAGKGGKFFSLLGQQKLPPGKSVTSIPSPSLLVEGNHERRCTL
jgi:hypothetical protein